MSRLDRNIWFERLLALRDSHGQWVDDTESVISVADVVAYADAVLTAAELDDEPWPAEAGETTIAYWPDGTQVGGGDVHRSVLLTQPGPLNRHSADGRPRHGRFFYLPNAADQPDPA